MEGTYTGPDKRFAGKTALLRECVEVEGLVLAQFDDMDLRPWCYGWHPFPAKHFKIETPEEG